MCYQAEPIQRRMASSGMSRRMALVGTDLITLLMEVVRSSETLVLTRATRRNISEDVILHSHCSENFKSYIALTGCNR
jgi:hypothetical protein